VRNANHAFLQTDLAAMQKELEAKLIALHQGSSVSPVVAEGSAQIPTCYIRIDSVESAPDCPARVAGLKPGDLISKMDGRG
jgi:hypothetical protein